jgi:hypothetical protein
MTNYEDFFDVGYRLKCDLSHSLTES